jgi:hypothetical protein
VTDVVDLQNGAAEAPFYSIRYCDNQQHITTMLVVSRPRPMGASATLNPNLP